MGEVSSAHEFLSGLTLDRDNLTFHCAPEPQSPSTLSSPLSSLESDEEEGDLTPPADSFTPLSSLDSDDDLLRGSHNVSLPAPRVHLSLSSKSDDEGDVPAESRGHWPPHFPEVPHTHEAAMSAIVAEGGKGGPVVKMEVDTEELNYDNGYEVDYIEVDRDGLRTVRDCVGAVFDPDSVCRFCAYASQVLPYPFCSQLN
ncbi:hypothetical protein B0H13DRAFT_2331803 [Mycena leptocephala]|nr:hypothetical protein B0H13DRAFT_2331803 [Mycena leptocephala]